MAPEARVAYLVRPARRVAEAFLAFGGMAPTTIAAPRAAAALVGKRWAPETLEACYAVLADELALPADVPGGMPEFRTSVACGNISCSFSASKACRPNCSRSFWIRSK